MSARRTANRSRNVVVKTTAAVKMMPEPVFALFACCIPVQGARRSVVCDVQRQSSKFTPAGLYEILTEHRGKTVPEIKAAYGHEYDEEIDEYFEFLLRHELGFWCDDPDLFPAIDLTWET